MPYSAGFTRALMARAHGADLHDKKLNKISPGKAKSLLEDTTEADRSSAMRDRQKKALR